MKYIGPNYNKGLKIGGRFFYKPGDWDEKTIKANIKLEPKLKEYFTESKKNKSQTDKDFTK